MRALWSGTLLALLLAAPAAAQERPSRFEIGLAAGPPPGLIQTGSSAFDGSLTTLGIYADVRLGSSWVVSPFISSLRTGSSGLEAVRLRTDLRYHFRPSRVVSPYLFAGASAYLNQEPRAFDDRLPDPGAESRSEAALGAGAGLRLALPLPIRLSVEARYDRWLDSGRNQVGFGVRVGLPFGGSPAGGS